jgi:Flp pilus assembly protein TadD
MILWIGLIQFYARQFSQAVESLSQVGRLRPYFNNFHSVMAAALAFLGRLDEARDVLLRAPPLDSLCSANIRAVDCRTAGRR